MNVLLLDFETTGLDVKSARPIEIGYQITTEDFSEVVSEGNSFVYAHDYPTLSQEVMDVTGLKLNDIVSGDHPSQAISILADECVKHGVGGIVAYNAEYDMSILQNESLRLGIHSVENVLRLLALPYVCAMVDKKDNYKFKCRKLSHISLDYGLTIDPATLHRALGDVNLMRRMLFTTKTSFMDLLNYKREPWVYLTAKTLPPWEDNGKSNELVKADGYSWQQVRGDSKTFTKQWVKRVKESEATEHEQRPFKVVRHEPK